MDRRENPVVLWLADEKGWAYDAIVQNVSQILPGYEHQVWYMMAEHTWQEWAGLGYRMAEVGVIVSMHLMYQKQLFHKTRTDNIAMMLTGPRLFE